MKKLWKFFIAILVSSIGFMGWKYPDGKLRVVMCDVGQGDSLLIQQAFYQVVIDGGPDSRVLSCLGRYVPFFDTKIEMVILSHPDADHLNGLVDVVNRYKVDTLVTSGVGSSSEAYKKFTNGLKNQKTKVEIVKAGDRLRLGDLWFDILWPIQKSNGILSFMNSKSSNDGYEQKDEKANPQGVNSTSVVSVFHYEKFKVLFTGDLEFLEEQALKDRGVLSQVDVLKVAHHGSKTSTSLELLKAILPKDVLIGVGAKNRFGHPSAEVLSRLEEVKSRVWRTDVNGDVVIVSDGEKYWVED